MSLNITVLARSLHSQACAQAVAHGVRAKGGVATVLDLNTDITAVSTKHVAVWGWRRGKVLREKGHEVLVMERGYIGDRFAWYSLGWNGLNGRADFHGVQEDDGARFKSMAKLKPWRASAGRYSLLIGQVPGDMSLQGRDLSAWYIAAAVTARAAYDMPVLFREHPECIKRGLNRNPGYTDKCKAKDLSEALADAHVVMTYNSNTGVDALLAGIPVTVADPTGSMAHPIAGTHVAERKMPPREAWASRLAWKQWSLTEIARGVPFA